jgi:hypothetical protein
MTRQTFYRQPFYGASSLSERRSLAPRGRLVSGKIAQKQAKNGHKALCYGVLRQAARFG